MGENTLFALRDISAPADIPIDTMTASQCLDVLVHADKQRSRWEAVKARALARFAVIRRAGDGLEEGAPEEVAVELGMNPHTAAAQISQAHDLVTRLPATTAALEAGEIDYVRAKAMTDLTEVLTEAQALRVEAKVLAYGRRVNPTRFRQSIRHHVIAADPSAAERLRRTARATRDVSGRDLPDSMSQLAITLEPHEAQAAYDRINTPGQQRQNPGSDVGAMPGRRVHGPGAGQGVDRTPVQVNVMVPLTTLMGLNRHPGEISGFGPITAEYARELARDAAWRRVITDEHGHVLEVSRRRLASPALARHIRLRDRTCRQPGCNRPADKAEIDHTVRYNDGGVTSLDNTSSLCRKHNLMRERSSWDCSQPIPGKLVFRTPTSRVHVTEPEPYELPPF